MISTQLDHVAIGAARLDQGADWARHALGVDIPAGGTHPMMGTHNLLSAVSDSAYLEIIAIDPQLNAPGRPRWFNLDDPAQQADIGKHPRSLTWVVATPDIEISVNAALAVGVDPGRVVAASRGDLNWLITVRDDGTMPEGGAFPTFIQWLTGVHPAGRMAHQGLTIQAIQLTHQDPDFLSRALQSLGLPGDCPWRVDAGLAPGIRVAIHTPDDRLVTI